jgi:uncharacterized protein (TIGR02147 family)
MDPTHDQDDYRALLSSELERRQARNAAYSARAFAKQIGVSAPFLAQLMRKERALSETKAQAVAAALGWSKPLQTLFVLLVRLEKAGGPEASAALREQIEAVRRRPADFESLDLDAFRLVSDWYHFAIVELCDAAAVPDDPDAVGARLNLDAESAKRAIARLKRIGLIVARDGRLHKAKANYATADVPSAAIRKFHLGSIEQAKRALVRQPIGDRDFSSVTMAIDPDRIARAKEMIRDFRRDLMAFLEGGTRRAVYQMSVQLFRLDRELAGEMLADPAETEVDDEVV